MAKEKKQKVPKQKVQKPKVQKPKVQKPKVQKVKEMKPKDQKSKVKAPKAPKAPKVPKASKAKGQKQKVLKQKTRKMSIRTKILLPALIIIFIVSAGMGMILRTVGEKAYLNTGMERALMGVSVASELIDGSYVLRVHNGTATMDMYQNQVWKLREVRDTCGMLFLYTVYEQDGQYLYGIDTDESEKQRMPGDPYEGDAEAIKSAYKEENYVSDHVITNENGNLISAYVPIYDITGNVIGVLGCDYDGTEALEQVAYIQMLSTVCTIAALVLATLVIAFFVNAITKNIVLINAKIFDLVNNEGDLTQKLDIHSGDELELIGTNVNNLLEYIRTIMLNISDNSINLKGASQEVFHNLNEAQMNITDVSSTMEEMSAGMEETAASIFEITGAINGVYEAIDEINVKAGDSTSDAYEAMEKANEVYNVAIQTQEQARKMSVQISAVVEDKIEKSKAVNEIETLTKSILAIASQTNLLSLNASIEAARAGEAGRGFAVVAGEIGKLAQESADSASRIRQVSNEVILAVEELADASKQMISFVDETTMGGFQQLQKTAYDYKEDIQKMSATMEDFTASCEELKSNMDSIKNNIEAANIAVDESAKGISNVSEISSSLTSSVGDIQSQANGNMDIANQLNREVNRFKL